MAPFSQLLVFELGNDQYALDVSYVTRAIRAVEVMRLPSAPAAVMGVINMEGKVIPVVNCRKLLGLEERDIRISDRFIIARGSQRTVALVADSVKPVVEVPVEMITSADQIVDDLWFVEKVARIDNQLILVLEVDKILSGPVRKDLDAAIRGIDRGQHV